MDQIGVATLLFISIRFVRSLNEILVAVSVVGNML